MPTALHRSVELGIYFRRWSPTAKSLMSAWAGLAGDGRAEVRAWTSGLIGDNANVALLAGTLTFEDAAFALGDGRSLDDRVETKIPQIDPASAGWLSILGRLAARLRCMAEGVGG